MAKAVATSAFCCAAFASWNICAGVSFSVRGGAVAGTGAAETFPALASSTADTLVSNMSLVSLRLFLLADPDTGHRRRFAARRAGQRIVEGCRPARHQLLGVRAGKLPVEGPGPDARLRQGTREAGASEGIDRAGKIIAAERDQRVPVIDRGVEVAGQRACGERELQRCLAPDVIVIDRPA